VHFGTAKIEQFGYLLIINNVLLPKNSNPGGSMAALPTCPTVEQHTNFLVPLNAPEVLEAGHPLQRGWLCPFLRETLKLILLLPFVYVVLTKTRDNGLQITIRMEYVK